MLLDFLMRLMLAAKRAELLQLQPLGLGLLVLGLAVILPFALGALHGYDFAHFLRSSSVARIQESMEAGEFKKKERGAERRHLSSSTSLTS
jgi:uncharacterized membrane protein (DUF441 family)